jgi:hypothetical protein
MPPHPAGQERDEHHGGERLVDQPPNELTTAVVTGSPSFPETIAAGSGCARAAA